MEKILFTTEQKELLNNVDFFYLRNLYLPIIGNEAVTLYSLLADYHLLNEKNRTFFEFKELITTFGSTLIDVEVTRKKLEAVGLIRTHESADSQHLIFMINKPLCASNFRKNTFLVRQYLSVCSELTLERIEFAFKSHSFNKDNYKEITMKFQDVFDLGEIQFKEENIANTLELPLIEFKNQLEAIKGLVTSQFVKYLTHSTISPSLLSVINNLLKIGFSSASLNRIIAYSYEINGKIVNNHIQVIANDLFSKSINGFEDVDKELTNASISRNGTKQIDNVMSIKDDAIEWDDIFKALDGGL